MIPDYSAGWKCIAIRRFVGTRRPHFLQVISVLLRRRNLKCSVFAKAVYVRSVSNDEWLDTFRYGVGKGLRSSKPFWCQWG
jgi:hypothetical protein